MHFPVYFSILIKNFKGKRTKIFKTKLSIQDKADLFSAHQKRVIFYDSGLFSARGVELVQDFDWSKLTWKKFNN